MKLTVQEVVATSLVKFIVIVDDRIFKVIIWGHLRELSVLLVINDTKQYELARLSVSFLFETCWVSVWVNIFFLVISQSS